MMFVDKNSVPKGLFYRECVLDLSGRMNRHTWILINLFLIVLIFRFENNELLTIGYIFFLFLYTYSL